MDHLTQPVRRRAVARGAAACAAALAVPGIVMAAASGAADAWPNRALKLVIPYPPGGPVDAIARRIALHLGQRLGQTVVVESKAGANGAIGNDAVAKSAPDGHTLLLTTVETLIDLSPHGTALPYDARRDFDFVTLLGAWSLVFAVDASLPVTDLRGFVDHARRQGEALSYGNTGDAGLFHIACEALNRKHGSAAVHVPYRGLAPLTQDLVARRIQAAFGVAQGFQPFAASGQLRVLGVTGAQRVAAFPDVPTFAEQGFGDDAFQLRVWLGFLAPAGTPPPIVARLGMQIVRALGEPDMQPLLAPTGFEIVGTTPEQTRRRIDAELSMLPRIARALGLGPQ